MSQKQVGQAPLTNEHARLYVEEPFLPIHHYNTSIAIVSICDAWVGHTWTYRWLLVVA